MLLLLFCSHEIPISRDSIPDYKGEKYITIQLYNKFKYVYIYIYVSSQKIEYIIYNYQILYYI